MKILKYKLFLNRDLRCGVQYDEIIKKVYYLPKLLKLSLYDPSINRYRKQIVKFEIVDILKDLVIINIIGLNKEANIKGGE